MQLPRLLVQVIDPATVYLQDRLPQHSGPMFHGGAVFGPGVEGGARQATPAELERMRVEAEGFRLAAGTHQRPEVDPAVTAAAAHQLIERGCAAIQWSGLDLRAHIVTFWHGDSLVDITVHGADGGSSSSTTRVPRRLSAQHEPMLVQHLNTVLHAAG